MGKNLSDTLISAGIGAGLGYYAGKSKLEAGPGTTNPDLSLPKTLNIISPNLLMHDVSKQLSPDFLRLLFHVVPVVMWERRLLRRSVSQNATLLANSIIVGLGSGTNIPASAGPILAKRTEIKYDLFAHSEITSFQVPLDERFTSRPTYRIYHSSEGSYFEKWLAYGMIYLNGLKNLQVMRGPSDTIDLDSFRFDRFDYKKIFDLSDFSKAILECLYDEQLLVYHNPINGWFYFKNQLDDVRLKDIVHQYFDV